MQQTLPTQAVKGIISDEEGRILFLKGSSHKLWDLPGGLIGPGESHEQTLIREVSEETGLSIKVSSESTGKWQFVRASDKKIVKVINYNCKILNRSGSKIILSDEHINFKWFSINEIKIQAIKDPSLLSSLEALQP